MTAPQHPAAAGSRDVSAARARVRLRAAAFLCLAGTTASAAAPVRSGPEAKPVSIVAIGASNTSGWGVGEAEAYPARLETRLRQAGYDARVVNSGIPFETTNGMLGRIDASVPAGTRIVVIQPGGNDLRFLGTAERRTANIRAMVASLCGRGIEPIVYDPFFPPEQLQWDWIHLNRKGHARVADDLLPRVAAILERTGAARAATSTGASAPAGQGARPSDLARTVSVKPPRPGTPALTEARSACDARPEP